MNRILLLLLLLTACQNRKAANTVDAPPKQNNTSQAIDPDSLAYKDRWAGEMLYVKGGSFLMGSDDGQQDEKPVHRVTVPDFYLGKYEVTQAQWKAIMKDNPSHFKDCEQCPVETVGLEDIQLFLQKLNKKTKQSYRLPTEAEWEYAAGGGAQNRTIWPGTSDPLTLTEYVQPHIYRGENHSRPVGQKKPNTLGFYDMAGNVGEWCQDRFQKTYQGAPTDGSAWQMPVGPTFGDSLEARRVYRGGSWLGAALYYRVANRSPILDHEKGDDVGFRLARSVGAP